MISRLETKKQRRKKTTMIDRNRTRLFDADADFLVRTESSNLQRETEASLREKSNSRSVERCFPICRKKKHSHTHHVHRKRERETRRKITITISHRWALSGAARLFDRGTVDRRSPVRSGPRDRQGIHVIANSAMVKAPGGMGGIARRNK